MNHLIACDEAVRKLWQFLDEGLTDLDRRAIEEHLDFCVRCCGELQFAQHLRRLLRSTADVSVPSDVEARLDLFIDTFSADGGSSDKGAP